MVKNSLTPIFTFSINDGLTPWLINCNKFEF
jgi:hypothetical protein